MIVLYSKKLFFLIFFIIMIPGLTQVFGQTTDYVEQLNEIKKELAEIDATINITNNENRNQVWIGIIIAIVAIVSTMRVYSIFEKWKFHIK